MKNLILIIFVILLVPCSGQNKNRTEKGPLKNNSSSAVSMHSVEMSDGIIYFSDNNGMSWENKSKGLPAKVSLGLGAIAVSNNQLGIATKENGVYLFDFQKDSWINIPTPEQIIESNLGTMIFFKSGIFVGTQKRGVFYTADQGKSWTNLKTGFANLTVRKLIQIGDKLFAGTNEGLYVFDESGKKWDMEYGNNAMQVNGMTGFHGNIYIATNQGVFTSSEDRNNWKQILANCSVHNINTADNTIYAMVYNELLSSTDEGRTWQNIQKGLPAELYTFNVIKNGNFVFAGQWNGVYRKDNTNVDWKSYSVGLPEKLAITNMKSFNGIIVVSGSERGFRTQTAVEK